MQQALRRSDSIGRWVEDRVPPVALRNPADHWWQTVKASDEFLDPVFDRCFAELSLPNLMRTLDYHRLADLLPNWLIFSLTG
jgi:hypothetical protein